MHPEHRIFFVRFRGCTFLFYPKYDKIVKSLACDVTAYFIISLLKGTVMNGKKLYKPAEFGKLVGMTKRALRHYNEMGILLPACENEYGHKFYTDESFFEAQRILSLRFVGFSLEEIRNIQQNHGGVQESLKLQREALLERKRQIEVVLGTITDMECTVHPSEEVDWEKIFNAIKLAKYQSVKEKMMQYYDERAAEYDEIFEGKGPATYRSEYYARDIEEIRKFMGDFGRGNIIDIACGSGYWIQYYYERCRTFTFIDQSEKMLKQCRKKIDFYGIAGRALVIKGDILEHEFAEECAYDSAVIGFLLGHFTPEQETILFDKLKYILKPGSEILVIDSTWTRERAKKQNKEDIAERHLNDGRSFKIYKRYFDEGDLAAILDKYGITVKKSYFGTTFTAIIGIVPPNG